MARRGNTKAGAPAADNAQAAEKPGTEAAQAAPVEKSDEGQAKAAGGDKTSPAEGKLLVVVVTGPKRGRWRAGRHFTAEPRIIPVQNLSEADKAALIADPRLAVETREAD